MFIKQRTSCRCLVLFLLSLIPSLEVTLADEPLPSIGVSGSAVIYVAPDKMMISGSIESRAKTVAEASRANTALVEKTRVAVDAIGIAANDVSIEQIYISPMERRNTAKNAMFQSNAQVQTAAPASAEDELPKPVGYRVTRSFKITLSKLEQYEEVYEALVAAGVNSIGSVQLRTSALHKYKDQARTEAVKAAHEKATAMADVLGVSLKGVKSIREESDHNPFASNLMQNFSAPVGDDDPLPAGQMSVTASVDVEFYLDNDGFRNE